MKRIVFTLLITLSTLGLFAQTGNLGDKPDECKKYLSLYTGYLKDEVYKDAYKWWVEAVKVCPDYNANLYDNGVYIMKKLRKSATKERKKSLADSIIWAYEESIKRFGETPAQNQDYGKDLILLGKVEKGVEVMKKAIDALGDKTRASSIIYYSNALALLENKEKMDCEVLVQEYDRLSTIIGNNKGKAYAQAQERVDKYLGPCLTCDKLLPVVKKKFEKAKTDSDLRKKTLALLDSRGCTDNDIFITLTEIENDENPTAKGYLYLTQIYVNKGQKSKAKENMDKAIKLAETDEDKVDLIIKAAKLFPSSASSYAKDALAIDPNCGEAYLIKANLIARSKCGTSRFDDQAIYWAAYDMAAKAKSIDPSVSSESSKAMSSYRARFPEKNDVFAQGLKAGQAYKTCNGYSTTVK